MIISYKHKFIFIKPQKTAGTSVELMLSRICGDKDVITPLGFDPDPNVREKHNATPPQNYYRKKPFKHWKISEMYHHFFKNKKTNSNYWEHLNADLIRQYVGDDIWHSYKKVSIVRNPWDHAVSWFKWQEIRGIGGTTKGEFKKYLINNYRSTWPYYTIKHGFYDIDFMIKFENIDQDIEELLKLLDIKEKLILPKTKNKIREKKDYRDFYTSIKMRDIVYEKALPVVDKFKYNFDSI